MSLRFLHLHSSFDSGGKELRAARLMNTFGEAIAHDVVSAEPGALGAASAIAADIRVAYPADFPALQGKPTPARLRELARAMAGYDLVLTYNWGAMDAVLAHTVFRKTDALPPLIHHEDGFNEDESGGLKRSRNWFRRIALARSAGLVVPSKRLEAIALGPWQQPRGRVQLIPNGIDIAAYGRKPSADALPRIVKRKDEVWLGTLAGLRPVKNLPRLVRAFAAMPGNWQLVILGEGPERAAIREEALRCQVADRVHLPGFVAKPSEAVGLFDLFALSSDSEQFPISVVEAMAAGIAVASPDVGDVAGMVSPDNRPFVVPADDEAALADALVTLASDPALRDRIGHANRLRALAEFDEPRMIGRYRRLYASAMGLDHLP
ncbi:glycosyl transferase family 1 [Novosphingobium sp. PC22D]|uniref:glycosyltransferase family 4 protein n=1 Tax=Novosphingobium sp. PC22D TaxID=1962403 RepID=UPI000BF1EC6A|nr:glycosyltransferase family 4 protein [Novosphingobium sp. PC22D]PEQ12950.1 glycosyl transferase family 1 [Novosphingobium sp. PC22D]